MGLSRNRLLPIDESILWLVPAIFFPVHEQSSTTSLTLQGHREVKTWPGIHTHFLFCAIQTAYLFFRPVRLVSSKFAILIMGLGRLHLL